MKYSSRFLAVILLQIFLFSNLVAQTSCEDPLSLDWLQFSLGDPCVEGIYAFEYNDDPYVYVASKPECIAADARNTLYNCTDESFCYYFGFTLPSDQCDQSMIDAINPLLTNQNLIYPLSISRTCENPLQLEWVKESLTIPCTDGIYAFEYGDASYVYQSTACEYLDVPNRLYNCNDKSTCFIDGRTFPEDQCNLIEFPLEDFLIDRNLIWASPLLRLVPEYPWLTAKVNLKNCDDVEIKEFKTSATTYLSIKNENTTELYAQNGSLLCTNSVNFICTSAYGLSTPNEEWTCNRPNDDCESLQFTSLNSGCDCCNGLILFEIEGGDGNYEVTTLDGQVVTNGMGLGLFSIGANELTVTDGQGCSATGIFNNFPFCCEVRPVCEAMNISYNCVNGLQITGFGDCNSIPLKDQNGNSYNHGDILEEGTYTFVEANEGQVSPPCIEHAITVNCSEGSVCNLPPDSGPCEAYIPRYHYNPEAQECMQFIYGGCEGNENNYETYEACTNACGYNYACSFIETPLELPWLQRIIENANGCTIAEISLFTYNNNFYFKTTPGYGGGFCPADLPLQYYNCDGLRLCSQGFTPFPTCNQAMVNAANTSAEVIWTYSEDNCSDLQFDFIYGDCDSCCNETLSFSISGGNGNYSVSTTEGIEVFNGMPLYTQGLGDNFTLIVTDGQGCTAEQAYTHYPICCEAPPICEVFGLTYDCASGIQIIGEGECNDSYIFTDEANNIYEAGAILENGIYNVTTSGHPISPPCASYELIVNCNDVPDYCNFEDVVITSNPDFCGEAIITLTTNDVFGDAGPDDGEIVFAKVNNDNSYELIQYQPNIFGNYPCYYAIAYRSSCEVPDFSTNNFNDVINNAGAYKVSTCFAVNFIQAPEYSITTEAYCDGEGLFTVGITISGGSGFYNLGKDYTGNTVYGETGENLITFASNQSVSIYPIDAETGCANDYVFGIDGPDCGSLSICELPPATGPCEAAMQRYYYDVEQGDCLEFIYGGCDGNANNFETYTACLQACGNNSGGCDNPFSLEIVQNAINNPTCTDAIYAFTYQNENFVFFKSACLASDLPDGLYNCNTGLACSIGGFTIPVEGCDELYYQVSNLIIDENIIWQPDNDCGCDADYTPVCGLDGITYSNACQAACAGIEVAYEGACEEPCICPAVYDPVCGVDGVTYGNSCEAACAGVEIANEGACSRVELNCSSGDPLQWTWLQNLIIQNGGCLIAEVKTFTYQGTQHFVTNPGYPPNLACATDAPSNYYNCEGDLICQVGFFPPDDPNFCNDEVIEAARNSTVIWTYNETNCADPFELEMVQRAIEDETCTGGIYAFDFEGESFIYIQTLCEFIDAPNVLYNCNTGIACSIGGETIFVEACYDRFDQINHLTNEENLIWTKPCEYEHTGVVKDRSDTEGCGLVIELLEDILYPATVPDGFTLRDGQTVELTYRSVPIGSPCPDAQRVEIICIRTVDEGCACDDVYEPVCGVDGVTYANACQAECEGVNIAQEGECEEDCICIALYDPVCGVDGKTYGNDCEAACAGVDVAYVGECTDNNSAILNTYSWLNEFIFSYGSCQNGISVAEYAWSASFSFVHIQWPNGAGELYYQDGTYYCTDGADYSCLEVYGLTNEVSRWTCNQTDAGPNDDVEVSYGELNCMDDGSFTIEISATGALSGAYGIYHTQANGQIDFIDFNEGETIVYTGNVADAENGLLSAFVYDRYLADVAAKRIAIDVSNCIIVPPTQNNRALFNQYDWLSSIIDPDNCTPGYEITEYDFGSYSFVHVLANNEGNLYLGDGTYYCSDATGFSCVEVYGFTNPTATTGCRNTIDCPDVLEPVCGSDGNTYDNACLAESAGTTVAYEGACTSAEMFDQYVWLNELINETGCDPGTSISEFDLGSYSFIYIQYNNNGSLYYQDGTFYCADAPGYSCLGLYSFSEASTVWSCEGNVINKEQDNTQETLKALKIDEAFKVYPNPSQGKFMVELVEPAQNIHIFGIDGELLQSLAVESHQTQMEVDLTGIAKGMYMIQLQNANSIKTQKMIIH